jgi:hypothetical protein
MKKIGIITLTKQNSLAYSVLTRIVRELGYRPLTGEAIGADCLFFSLEDITLVGYDFLGDLFQKAGFSEADAVLISAPYSVNVFMLPKVIWCLRSLSHAPIILGGNEASNNHRDLMEYRFSTFANQTVDVSPDFIVRGSAEGSLHSLLSLIDKTTMTHKWDRNLIMKFLEIPNLVFWLPGKEALIATEFFPSELKEKDIFSYVRYGDKTVAITFQRACVWAKKSQGGCLFCAIASQFGKNFHCAVQSDYFVEELSEYLNNNPEVQYVDIWDDTFNIREEWSIKICDYLQDLRNRVGREIIYSCFLRPKGLSERLLKRMAETNFRVAFIGADALTEGLSKRMRRGCTVAEVNRSIEGVAKSRIQPRLSVQLFSPESTIDDGGITTTLALSCIRNEQSTVHLHLYTFPLFGADVYKLLNARDNLKRIPTPLLKKENNGDFKSYSLAYDYMCYDPDVEEIKQKTYALLGISTSFHVRTYPGDHVDARQLKEALTQVRVWFTEEKKTHTIKSLWCMVLLFLENEGKGLSKKELLSLFSRNESDLQIPAELRRVYGNFGYRFTLGRSLDEVIDILVRNKWVEGRPDKKCAITPEGLDRLGLLVKEAKEKHLNIAAYGKVNKPNLLTMFSSLSAQ